MITKRFFHFSAIVCLLFTLSTPFARAAAEDVDVSILITNLPTNIFQVYGGQPGTDVTATVIDPENIQNPVFSGQQESIADGACYFSPNVCATFQLPVGDLKPGWTITATIGEITVVFTIADVKVTSVNLDTDIVSGTVEPVVAPDRLAVLFFYPQDCSPEGDYVQVDGSGNWTADFSGYCDVTYGSWGALNFFGDHGVQIGSWRAPGWTLSGFYPPVDMDGVYNVVKSGSTVPFKFEIFTGATERTDTADILGFTYEPISCDAGASTDVIETTATGSASLHYDTTSGQFVSHWKTPKEAGTCYQVTMTTSDYSSLVAYFKLK